MGGLEGLQVCCLLPDYFGHCLVADDVFWYSDVLMCFCILCRWGTGCWPSSQSTFLWYVRQCTQPVCLRWKRLWHWSVQSDISAGDNTEICNSTDTRSVSVISVLYVTFWNRGLSKYHCFYKRYKLLSLYIILILYWLTHRLYVFNNSWHWMAYIVLMCR